MAVSERNLRSATEISDAGEIVPVPGNIRGLGEPMAVSRAALEDYNRYLKSDLFAKNHSMLILMMSRVDSTGSFRGLEREVLARRVTVEIFELLQRARPTVAIFDVTPHEVFEFALLKVLEWCGIPVLMFQPTLVGPQMVARTGISTTLEVPLTGSSFDRKALAQSAVVAISLAALARLSAGTGTPKMDSQREKEANSSRFRARFLAARFSLRRLRGPGQDSEFALTGHNIRPAILKRALEIYLERSLRQRLRSSAAELPILLKAPKYRFALMALHYEPERSSIPEGYPYDSQIDAVIAARNFLPDDVELLVKEHFSQHAVALRGFVGRSPAFYDLVTNLPGVCLIGSASNTRALMRGAECVVTLTGKVGIEAVGEGKPVLALGQPWWLGMPGTSSLDDGLGYESFLNHCDRSRDSVDSWLRDMVEGVLLPGVASVPPDRYSERIARLPEGFEELEAQSLTSAFNALLATGVQTGSD